MIFSHKRQSRDKKIIDVIYDTLLDVPLYMSKYSSELFDDYKGNIVVDDGFLNKSDFSVLWKHQILMMKK